APQVGLVEQLAGLQVGRKRQLGPERNLDLAPAADKVHVIDLLLKRHQQAVEDLLRRDALATEIVDQQHAAVGLHLQRRSVGTAAFLEGRVEHLELELAANLHHRARDAAPAP